MYRKGVVKNMWQHLHKFLQNEVRSFKREINLFGCLYYRAVLTAVRVQNVQEYQGCKSVQNNGSKVETKIELFLSYCKPRG